MSDPKTTSGMSSIKVLSPGGHTSAGEEEESMRMWAWFAVKQSGGKVVVTYDNFFTCQGGATLHWEINPATLALTIIAE